MTYIRFLFGGSVNTAISAGSYYLLNLYFSESVSLALSFWITFVASYFINSRFVFKNKGVKLAFLVAVGMAFLVQ